MEYEITYVSPDARHIHIGIPRTNFEHRHVDVATLVFLQEPTISPKPQIDVRTAGQVLEHVDTARQSSSKISPANLRF
jgi:hypothetical protein